MYKLVLGIVVVGLLQFAFVIYTRLQEPIDLSLAQVNSDFELAFSGPVFPDVYSEAPEPALDETNYDSRGPEYRPVYRTSYRGDTKPRPYRRQTFVPERYDAVRQALPEDFSTIVISYSTRGGGPARDCGSRDNNKPAKTGYKLQYAGTYGNRWQVITTDFTQYN